MYIFKNAMRNIFRSAGRNILIGIIVLVIAASSCIAISIRKSADKARETTLEGMTITAHIKVDRAYVMKAVQEQGVDTSDRDAMQEALADMTTLSLDKMLEYSDEDCIKDFYYTIQAAVNGNDDLQAVSSDYSIDTEEDTEETTEAATEAATEAMTGPGGEQAPMMGGGDMGQGQMQDPQALLGSQGDFLITGYSSDDAMEDFINGVCTITDGSMFDENTTEYKCVVSDELSTYNSLEVGDTITICNPNDEDQTFELEIVGIYNNSDSSEDMTGGTANDPANNILMSYEAVKAICDSTASETDDESTDETTDAAAEETTEAATEAAAEETTDESSDDSEEEEDKELMSSIEGTYVLSDISKYDEFEALLAEREGEQYVLTSSEVASFESSLIPLDNLKTFASTFLIIILLIGGIILIVLHVFNIRERKYEIGVLTSMGMNKIKVALQFILEIFVVTIFCIVLGTGIGAAASVPVTDKLLESQITAQTDQSNQQSANFGRSPGQMTRGGDVDGPVTYVSSVSYSVDAVVLLEMIGIGMLLTLVSSSIAVLFIMRYQPLKILTNRD